MDLPASWHARIYYSLFQRIRNLALQRAQPGFRSAPKVENQEELYSDDYGYEVPWAFVYFEFFVVR